jgi:hypothetical protein
MYAMVIRERCRVLARLAGVSFWGFTKQERKAQKENGGARDERGKKRM